MPSYQVVYLNSDGSVAATMNSLCDSDTKAKVLAHAMRMQGSSKLEVWQDDTLIYARPWIFGAAPVTDYQQREETPRRDAIPRPE